MAAHEHVGDGQVGIVGKGGGLWCVEEWRVVMRLVRRHVDRVRGRRDMENRRGWMGRRGAVDGKFRVVI